MMLLRKEIPEKFGDTVIKAVRDYKKGAKTDIKTGLEEKLSLPESDVLYYETVEGFWFCIRPSGTEPKIKIYYGVSGYSDSDSEMALENLRRNVLSKIKPLLE